MWGAQCLLEVRRRFLGGPRTFDPSFQLNDVYQLRFLEFNFFFRFETVGICRKEWEMPKEHDAFMVSSAHESRQKLEIGANDSACVPFRRLRA